MMRLRRGCSFRLVNELSVFDLKVQYIYICILLVAHV